MRATNSDIQLAITMTTGRGNEYINPYQVALWLANHGYSYSMPEIRKALGMPEHEIDHEISVGISGLLADGREPRRGPRLSTQAREKQKIDEDLATT